MNKLINKISDIIDKCFNDTVIIDGVKYNRNAPREIINERAAKLARENRYTYSIMKQLVERYPDYDDKTLYHCAEGLNWGLSWNTLDKFYKNRHLDAK